VGAFLPPAPDQLARPVRLRCVRRPSWRGGSGRALWCLAARPGHAQAARRPRGLQPPPRGGPRGRAWRVGLRPGGVLSGVPRRAPPEDAAKTSTAFVERSAPERSARPPGGPDGEDGAGDGGDRDGDGPGHRRPGLRRRAAGSARPGCVAGLLLAGAPQGHALADGRRAGPAAPAGGCEPEGSGRRGRARVRRPRGHDPGRARRPQGSAGGRALRRRGRAGHPAGLLGDGEECPGHAARRARRARAARPRGAAAVPAWRAPETRAARSASWT
jgi:hypothetical protein